MTSTERLFGMPPAEFIARHWGKAGLRVHSRADLPPWGLEQCLKGHRTAYEFPGLNQSLFAQRAGNGARITPDQERFLFESGCVIGGEVLDAEAAILAASLKDELDSPGSLTILAQSIPAGERFGINSRATHRVLLLSTGEAMYVPPNTDYEIAGPVFTLDIALHVAPPADFLELLLLRAPGNEAMAAASVRPFDSQREGVESARRVIAGLSADSELVTGVWKEMVTDLGEFRNRHARSLGGSGNAVAPHHRLRVTPYFPVRRQDSVSPDGEASITVFAGGKRISDSGGGATLLARALEERCFLAGGVPAWLGKDYGWEDVEPYLSGLIEQGLLVFEK